MLSKLFRGLSSLAPLWGVLSGRRRRQAILLLLISVTAALSEVGNLGALMPFLRLLADPHESVQLFGPMGDLLLGFSKSQLLVVFGGLFIVVVIISSALRVLTIHAQLRLAALIGADLGTMVFGSVLRRPYGWYLLNSTSTTLGHLTNDVDSVVDSLQKLLGLAINGSIVLLLGCTLIFIAPLVMLGQIILFSLFYFSIFRLTKGIFRFQGAQYSLYHKKAIKTIQEALGGIRDVVLDHSQPFFVTSFDEVNRKKCLASAIININAQMPRYLIEGFSMILIIGSGLVLSLRGNNFHLMLPLLGTLALGAYRILQPLQQCFTCFSSFESNNDSLVQLRPFLTPALDANQISPVTSYPAAPKLLPSIVLSNVDFRYTNDGPLVLNNFNLEISPGSRVGFVGVSGSGKSTCADLLLGLLKPCRGQVLIDGKNPHLDPEFLAEWQRHVSHVPQAIYLSDSSFAENIAFGLPTKLINMTLVKQVAKQALIDELIESQPRGYSSLVGERGLQLSGGQRQRVGIARALYKRAHLLILDEATSALDNITEADVMDAIHALERKLTIILIAHRLSTVRGCDQIVLFENGVVSAVGTYASLMQSSKGFQALAMAK